MSAPSWQVSGQYYETCSCDFVCPCIPGQLAVKPTKGSCTFVMTYQVEKGRFGDIVLDGLTFILLAFTPAEMGKGDWSVGVIADERASAEQRDAIVAIASGQAGGPIAALGPLVGKFLGVTTAAIRVDRDGPKWSVKAGGLVDMAAEAAFGLNPNSKEPLYLDNTGHPANDRFALAHASRSQVNALGLQWEDKSGRNNGQFAPFNWRSA